MRRGRVSFTVAALEGSRGAPEFRIRRGSGEPRVEGETSNITSDNGPRLALHRGTWNEPAQGGFGRSRHYCPGQLDRPPLATTPPPSTTHPPEPSRPDS